MRLKKRAIWIFNLTVPIVVDTSIEFGLLLHNKREEYQFWYTNQFWSLKHRIEQGKIYILNT